MVPVRWEMSVIPLSLQGFNNWLFHHHIRQSSQAEILTLCQHAHLFALSQPALLALPAHVHVHLTVSSALAFVHGVLCYASSEETWKKARHKHEQENVARASRRSGEKSSCYISCSCSEFQKIHDKTGVCMFSCTALEATEITQVEQLGVSLDHYNLHRARFIRVEEKKTTLK